MIVVNDDQEKQDSYNGPTIRPPERVARRRRSWSPLPDYEASEAQYRKSLALEHKKAWHQTKMWRAVLFLLLAYTLLTIVVGVPIIVTKLKDNGQDRPWNDPSLLGNQFASSGGVIIFGNDTPCNTWSDTDFIQSSRPYTATLQLQLPTMGDISIRSNATLEDTPSNKLSGNLSVEYDADLKSNSARISVILQTSTLALQEATLVCYTDIGPNRGLSIFFPDNMTDKDSISMDIRVVFPRAISSSLISNFNVYLPMFTQDFGDLTKVNFDSVSIDGIIRPINVTSVQAPRVTVKNMLGDISGVFNASESLVLDTLKGIIDASITLVKPASRSSATTFLLDTGDDLINAEVSLFSSAKFSSLSPHFVGKVNNFNAPVNLTFNQLGSPSAIPVYFTIQNNLAQTKVVMDQKFEGTFLAQTKLDRVTIQEGDENPKYDPLGSDRPRTLIYDNGSSSSRTSGWIGWGNAPPSGGQSHVEILSSLGPIDLQFGPT